MGLHPAPELRGSGNDQLEDEVVLVRGRQLVRLPREVAQAATWNKHSDTGNAELYALLNADTTRYDHARKRWLVWEGHRWRSDDNGAVYRLAAEVAKIRYMAAGAADLGLDSDGRKRLAKHAVDSESAARIEALLRRARTLEPIADAGLGWDAARGLIGAPNGVVDLRTGELREGRPEDRITMQTGVPYDPRAQCPRFEQFLSEVLEDADKVAPWLQRLVGYSLTAEASLHLLVFLMGNGGNGKGAFLRAISRAFGDYSRVISARAFDAYTKGAHTTEVADLAGSRFAYCEELGDSKLNAGRMKDVSGGGDNRARRICADSFSFEQTWQLFLSTNDLPRSNDNSWGWWRRVRAIDFPRRFTDDEAGAELERVLLGEESAGILTWAVRGAVAWYREGLGDDPEAVREKTAQYREDVDPLEPLFEAGVLVLDEGAWTPTAELFAAYTDASFNGASRTLSEDAFSKALRGRFPSKRREVDDSYRRGYLGVRVV